MIEVTTRATATVEAAAIAVALAAAVALPVSSVAVDFAHAETVAALTPVATCSATIFVSAVTEAPQGQTWENSTWEELTW